MVIDTSALVALLEEEETASGLRLALAADDVRLISTVSVLVGTGVLGARSGPASYVLAQSKGEPLLFVGGDFSQTDVHAVPYS